MTVPRSSSWQGQPDGLIGRDPTLLDVREQLFAGGRTVVVSGIAGAGKTSVLHVAARLAAADGARVLALTCHASERDLAFAALTDLASSAPGSEDVLELVLPPPGVVVSPLELRLRVLDWLRVMSADRPTIVLVDDVQWCDDSSLSVLGFVAHRLSGTNVSLLAAVRGATPAVLRGSIVVELPPLSSGEARRLLRQAGLEMDSAALSSVIGRSAGNPLALLELGRAAAGPISRATIPSTVELAFAGQLAALPGRTRWVLLLAAACDGDLPALGRIVDPERLVEDLAPSELSGLVTVADRLVRFRHPLARTAAYSAGTMAERVRAHALLATAYGGDPMRHVWHRAEAAVTPDEGVATALVSAAERAQRQGAAAEAARFMRRASELSPGTDDRDSRLLEAASLSSIAGNFDLTAQMASRLRDECEDPAISAWASVMAAYALSQTKQHSDALVALIDALDRLLHIEPLHAWTTLTTLAVIVYRSGAGGELVTQWLDRCERATAHVTPLPAAPAAARAWVRVQVDPLVRPPDVLELIHETSTPRNLPAELASSREMLLGAAAWQLGELPTASSRLRRAIEQMRRTNAAGQVPQTLTALGLVQFDLGDYDGTERSGQEVIDLAEAAGLSYAAGDGLELRAKVAGIRGDAATARELCDRIMLDLHVGEYLAMEANVRMTMSWVRLAEDDPQGAWDEVRWLFDAHGEPRHTHICYRDLGGYVATAVRAGAGLEAASAVDVAARRLAGSGPYYRVQLARAQALLSAENAEPFHREAVTHPVAAQRPFELANAQMEYGAWLRRRHRVTEARVQLQAALRVFERLGTRVWADLARTELRAAGVRTTAPDTTTPSWRDLTGQEKEVVRLAAGGMTNREIAASLFLSPKTVATHLYNAFPKLGVTSRAQLRDVVEGPDLEPTT